MANRLVHASSPYLLQHANNPVDWYPWGDEALAVARETGRPILLSVGYSACHWCHVMERESFEDDTVAARMNARFVNVKVDREERPDLDELYMNAVQAFRDGHGGWPMTVFLTPDGAPFFGGTYYPPEPRDGQPSFTQVLDHVDHVWRERRTEVDRVVSDLQGVLQRSMQLPAPEPVTKGWTRTVAEAVLPLADPEEGGFRGRPKFPPHGTLAALLVDWHLHRDPAVQAFLTRTLDGMAKGGLYDLLGGGFARYSVDETWRVPHFEKMLYDNAQLVPIYIDAARAFDQPRWARIAEETCDYVLREMTLPDGGVCAAQDADSEGVEGKFFAWTPQQLRSVLGTDDGDRAADLLQVTPDGTFEHGTSVLRLDPLLESLSTEDARFLRDALPRLKEARDRRVWPARDDKVITSQAALMVHAWAVAGSYLDAPRFIDAAAKAARFIETHLVVDGRLRRAWRSGRAPILAYADDHAAFVRSLVSLYQATDDLYWLDRALVWADVLVELFWDADDGALFYTGHDAERLVVRSKHPVSSAEPGANALAAIGFSQLALLTGRSDLGDRADAILSRYQPLVMRHPRAFPLEAVAAAWRTETTEELAVFGDPDAPETREMRRAAIERHRPLLVVAGVGPEQVEAARARIPWLENRGPGPRGAKAYLCRGHACQLPARTAATLRAQLASTDR